MKLCDKIATVVYDKSAVQDEMSLSEKIVQGFLKGKQSFSCFLIIKIFQIVHSEP